MSFNIDLRNKIGLYAIDPNLLPLLHIDKQEQLRNEWRRGGRAIRRTPGKTFYFATARFEPGVIGEWQEGTGPRNCLHPHSQEATGGNKPRAEMYFAVANWLHGRILSSKRFAFRLGVNEVVEVEPAGQTNSCSYDTYFVGQGLAHPMPQVDAFLYNENRLKILLTKFHTQFRVTNDRLLTLRYGMWNLVWLVMGDAKRRVIKQLYKKITKASRWLE